MMRLSMESEGSVKVLLVVVEDDSDSDSTCVHMLRKLNFQVEVVKHPKDALDTLVRTRGEFDVRVVISDVNMPGIHRFQQFGIPVLLICDEKQEGTFGLKMQNVLRKPVSAYELKDLWQIITAHQKKCNLKVQLDHCNIANITNDVDTHKSKFNWTTERHFKFMDAIQILGGLENKNAVPNKILRVMMRRMNEPGLTREHVSSHLQKYRKFKISGSKRMNKLARNDKVYHAQQSQQDVSSSYSSLMSKLQGDYFLPKNDDDLITNVLNFTGDGGEQQLLVSPVLENNIYQESGQDNSYGYHWIDFANGDFYNQLTINQCLPNQQIGNGNGMDHPQWFGQPSFQQQVNGDTSFGWPQHQTFQENFNQPAQQIDIQRICNELFSDE